MWQGLHAARMPQVRPQAKSQGGLLMNTLHWADLSASLKFLWFGPWETHSKRRARTWQTHGNSYHGFCHAVAMVLPCHAIAMLLPCYCHNMAITWQSHGNNMAIAWQPHGKTMVNIAMLLPCSCHAFVVWSPFRPLTRT
jgi:hypothetical protein